MGIIMTYSVNDLQSFNAMENWLRQIKTHASENVVKVLVANKIDCNDRCISYDQGKSLADSFGV
jgi:Ras-related protein Rab-8A